MSQYSPVELEKTADRELVIEWDDGKRQSIPFRMLRDACQCATCGEARKKEIAEENSGQLRILSVAETAPLDIVSMKPVGNYGYNIEFSDGHTTGIFTFELLRSIQ